jgi:threonine synthase
MKKQFMDETFDKCVDLLEGIAKRTGLTYKQVNFIIFCAAWPMITIWFGYKALKK